jgi:threonine dehydrogenase-like Zn-dependent dehydrogenase
LKAGVWEGDGEIRCREVEPPRPGAGEALVEIAYCGICGTDLHILDGEFRIGRPPQVLGHEASGVVAAVGAGVDPEWVGRRVGLNPIGPCGVCVWCRRGLVSHCSDPYFSAKAFAELALYRPNQLHPLPDGLPLLDAALLEPWATAVRAVETARLEAGENVLVIGGGSLGLLVATAARLLGSGSVSVSEPRAANRALALRRGADAAVDPTAEDLAALAAGSGELGGFDAIFEVAGAPPALAAAPALLRPGGRLVILGVHGAEVGVPFRPREVTDRELAILGSFGGGDAFARATALLPKIDGGSLVTAVEPLGEIATLFARVREGAEVKAMLRPGAPDRAGAAQLAGL